MANTLVAVFNTEAQARSAMDALVESGIQETYIEKHPDSITNHSEGDGVINTKRKGFFASLFGSDDDSSSVYEKAVDQGNTVVTVDVDTPAERQAAVDILNRFMPIDIESSGTMGSTGTTTSTTTATTAGMTGSTGLAAGTMGTTTNLTDTTGGNEARIPIIEEQLHVGKREVERGGIRVVQRVTSRPVQENVSLREEHVTIERHPVNQPATAADMAAFKEGSFEVRETAEEAVVAKDARIVEEVVVSKDVEQRTETISDTVRRTDVDVQEITDSTLGTKKSPKQSL